MTVSDSLEKHYNKSDNTMHQACYKFLTACSKLDVCDVTLSVYPHRASLKNMPGHGGNRTYDLWNSSPMLCQLSYAVRSVRPNLLQQLGTSSANTTCQQLVNRFVTTCLQTCNNLCVFTCVHEINPNSPPQ